MVLRIMLAPGVSPTLQSKCLAATTTARVVAHACEVLYIARPIHSTILITTGDVGLL